MINLAYAERLAELHSKRDRLLREAREIQRSGKREDLYLQAASAIANEIGKIEKNFIGTAALY